MLLTIVISSFVQSVSYCSVESFNVNGSFNRLILFRHCKSKSRLFQKICNEWVQRSDW